MRVLTNLDHDRQWFNTLILPSHESPVVFVCRSFSELRRCRPSLLQVRKAARKCKCKCKCRFIERDYVTHLMRYCLECPANRYVFKSRLNCSESTAGSLRQSGSEFQIVGPATEKGRVPKVPRRTRGTNS